MLRRRFDCRSISGMLTTTPQTPIKWKTLIIFIHLHLKNWEGKETFGVCVFKITGFLCLYVYKTHLIII